MQRMKQFVILVLILTLSIAAPVQAEQKKECLGTFVCYAYAGAGKTASGTRTTAGRTIAVDPKVIPLGSKVIINGKTYTAEDTGGAIKGKKVDIFVSSEREARKFGVRKLKVYIIRK